MRLGCPIFIVVRFILKLCRNIPGNFPSKHLQKVIFETESNLCDLKKKGVSHKKRSNYSICSVMPSKMDVKAD